MTSFRRLKNQFHDLNGLEKMKVELKRVDGDFHFEALGAANVPVSIDAAAGIGGQNAGARPMELLLMAMGSCSAIDVILILKKQKQKLKDVRIQIEGNRAEGQIPAVFTKINMHFILSGTISPQKVERAIALSVEKYCSVTAMLCKTAEISYSYEIVSSATNYK
jgi:putative redox protein